MCLESISGYPLARLPTIPLAPNRNVVLSSGAHSDRRAKPDLYSLGFSFLNPGAPAATSVPLPSLSPVVPQTSGVWFLMY